MPDGDYDVHVTVNYSRYLFGVDLRNRLSNYLPAGIRSFYRRFTRYNVSCRLKAKSCQRVRETLLNKKIPVDRDGLAVFFEDERKALHVVDGDTSFQDVVDRFKVGEPTRLKFWIKKKNKDNSMVVFTGEDLRRKPVKVNFREKLGRAYSLSLGDTKADVNELEFVVRLGGKTAVLTPEDTMGNAARSLGLGDKTRLPLVMFVEVRVASGGYLSELNKALNEAKAGDIVVLKLTHTNSSGYVSLGHNPPDFHTINIEEYIETPPDLPAGLGGDFFDRLTLELKAQPTGKFWVLEVLNKGVVRTSLTSIESNDFVGSVYDLYSKGHLDPKKRRALGVFVE
ncbi:MAG: hypothetical protein LBP36_03495 [Oscillospiraceae bacterium]|jgi:hypothetical protein|nr:hypothetical protein [Oscillospiraceae bacterium]